MTAIYADPRCLDHYLPGHPESPDRVRSAVSALQQPNIASLLTWPEVRPAELAVLEAVHDVAHIRRVSTLAQAGGGWLDPDTYVVPASFEAALLAAGATLTATSDVLAGHHRNGFVVVRPPGHHATRERAMGFCLFNNVAVAAQWALTDGGAERVAVLDVDVHHGNGTQDIFYERPDALYYSVHQFPLYPGTGRVIDVGAAEGVGATVNVPLTPGSGDQTYLDATDVVLAPALTRFRPDLVLVSLGFDAHWADPLSNMRLSTSGYAAMLGRILVMAEELCSGRVVVLLEGGYDLQAIADGARTVACLLAGADPPADSLGPAASAPEPPRAGEIILAACEIHDLPSRPAE